MLWIYRRCSSTNTISASGRQLLFNLVTPLCPRFPPHTYARLVSLNPVTGDFLRSPFPFRGDPFFLAIISIIKRFILQADIRCFLFRANRKTRMERGNVKQALDEIIFIRIIVAVQIRREEGRARARKEKKNVIFSLDGARCELRSNARRVN